jgi:hypothetical protein
MTRSILAIASPLIAGMSLVIATGLLWRYGLNVGSG